MTNKEYFEQYASVTWALEQNLAMMLHEYAEAAKIPAEAMPNSVTFVNYSDLRLTP